MKSLNRRSPIPDCRRCTAMAIRIRDQLRAGRSSGSCPRSATEYSPDSGGPTKPSPCSILPRADDRSAVPGLPGETSMWRSLLAAEGADEVRLRMQAVVNAKCGNMPRAPFCWYETAPVLLHKDSVNLLVAMGEQAAASIQAEFGLPLGLVVIDTMAVCAGYREPVTKTTAVGRRDAGAERRCGAVVCFVLGIDHYGKNVDAGKSGASSKEAPCDLVLACLGRKSATAVSRTPACGAQEPGRRAGPGISIHTAERECAGERRRRRSDHDDGCGLGAAPGGLRRRPILGRKSPAGATHGGAAVEAGANGDPGRTGLELPIPPDGPMVRMVDQKIVREQFYAHTPADGTPEQKRHARRQQFFRALAWAEDQQLIGVEEIDDVTYLRLTRPDPEDDDESRRLTSPSQFISLYGSELRRRSETVGNPCR